MLMVNCAGPEDLGSGVLRVAPDMAVELGDRLRPPTPGVRFVAYAPTLDVRSGGRIASRALAGREELEHWHRAAGPLGQDHVHRANEKVRLQGLNRGFGKKDPRSSVITV